MNPLKRIKNLYDIQKAYGLFRDFIENPELRKNHKFTGKFVRALIEVKEVIELIKFLQGKKSYIISALAFGVQAAFVMGYIDEATRNSLLQLLGAGAIATVSAKLNRIDKKIDVIEN